MHRALGRRNDDPDLKQFGYQSNTLQILRFSTQNTTGARRRKRHISWFKVYDKSFSKRWKYNL